MNDEARPATEMTLDEAREFVSNLPWRKVKTDPWFKDGVEQKPADPHWYVINGWPEVPADLYWAFVRLVKREGYRGRYVAPYRHDRPMVIRYLEIGEHVYWTIPPKQICRTRIEWKQHTPIPEQERLAPPEHEEET
jgi:hypothetical protein